MSEAPECPHCGGTARHEDTEVGVFIICDECGFESADQLKLDFKSD